MKNKPKVTNNSDDWYSGSEESDKELESERLRHRYTKKELLKIELVARLNGNETLAASFPKLPKNDINKFTNIINAI